MSSNLKSEEAKLKNIRTKVKLTGGKNPRLASEYMVRTARGLAGNRRGIMRKNINAFRRGKNKYEVVSHRWSRANEWKGNPGNRYAFPVHLWMEGKIKGSWGRKPYSAVKNKTGTYRYFTIAGNKTRRIMLKAARKDIKRALIAKFR